MRERGSALMVSVVGIGILLLISGVIFSSVISSYRIETSEEKGLKAYYLAQAGIQYAIFQVVNQDKDGDDEESTEDKEGKEAKEDIKEIKGTITEHITDPYEGQFTVTWEEIDNTGIYSIQSEGTYEGITRKLEAEYTLTDS